jgi:predicted TIM-barrel fold metal-dependent hydrolase
VVDCKVQNYLIAGNSDLPPELLRDRESLAAGRGREAVQYMFKEVGVRANSARRVDDVVAELDRWGIAVAQLDVGVADGDTLCRQLEPVKDRFSVCVRVNPHGGVPELAALQRLSESYRLVRSACIYPLATWPQIPPNAKECYPVYSKCAELGLPVFVTVGIPGPRVPSAVQDPMALDEICWFFPELTVVMMHGGEPWIDLCVKLLLKWPNLFYMTSAFAPSHYPAAIIHLLNTRGTEKVMYGGYWPTLSFERIMAEIGDLPLRDHAWEPFLSGNARRILGLPDGSG